MFSLLISKLSGEIVVVVVVAHIYPPVTRQHQTLYNLLDDPHTFHYQNYFVIGGIHSYIGVSNKSNVPVDFFEFLSTEFAACLKPSSRDNHREASYPKMQRRDLGAG